MVAVRGDVGGDVWMVRGVGGGTAQGAVPLRGWFGGGCGSVICDPRSGEINGNPLAGVHHSAAPSQLHPRQYG